MSTSAWSDTVSFMTKAEEGVLEQAKLIADDGEENAGFGEWMAISGDGNYIIAAATFATVDSIYQQGAVYVFNRSGTSWTQQAKLVASDGAAEEAWFGYSSVDITTNGEYAIVSRKYAAIGPNLNQGAVYVYSRNNTTWTEIAKLVANDGEEYDFFGNSASISGDGNYIAVGSSYNGYEDIGACYIFKKVEDEWVQQTKLTPNDGVTNDNFGYDVALSANGSYIVISSRNSDGYTGSAYIFYRVGDIWSQQAKLLADDGAQYSEFGSSVDISSDGSYVIIGAHYINGGGSGAAYVFARSGTEWSQQAKLRNVDTETFTFNFISPYSYVTPSMTYGIQGDPMSGTADIFTVGNDGWEHQTQIVGDDTTLDDYFGYCSAISADNNYAVVCAPANDSLKGAAYVFVRSGASWTQQAKLIASDGVAGDAFGFSVDISANGDYVVIGAPMKNEELIHSVPTAAYVFIRSGSTWSQQAKLVTSDGVTANYFGIHASISANGEYVAVSARLDNNAQGAVYIFTRSGTNWSQQAKLVASDGVADDLFGMTVKISADANYVFIGAVCVDVESNSRQGAAYIFSRSGAIWTEEFKLLNEIGEAEDQFGRLIFVHPTIDYIIIANNTSENIAYVFNNVEGNWIKTQVITYDSSVSHDPIWFGWSVAMTENGNRVAISAVQDNNIGAVYIFDRSDNVWNQQAKIVPSDGSFGDSFGGCVDISANGEYIAISANNADINSAEDQGAVYVFA